MKGFYRPAVNILISALLIMFTGRAAPAGIENIPSRHDVWIISVGVSNYGGPFDLRTPVADATAIANAFKQSWEQVAEVHCELLTDADATSDKVRSAIAQVEAQAKPDDTFIFFFSGHGWASHPDAGGEGQYYMLTAGNYGGAGEGAWVNPSNSVSATELQRFSDGIQAQRQLYILDACGAQDAMRTFVDRTRDSSPFGRMLDDRATTLLAVEGSAYEMANQKCAVLTTAILESLSGSADFVPTYDGITCRELEAYIPARVLTVSQGRQIALVESSGDDFMAAPLPPGRKRAPTPPISNPNYDPAETGPAPLPLRTRQANPAPDSDIAPLPASVPIKGIDYALLIATDDYAKFQHLANPIDDAEALERELHTRYGFQTELLKNPKREEILQALLRYRNKTYSPGDQLLIYVAGHGLKSQIDGDGDIVASDSEPLASDQFEDTFLSYAKLKTNLVSFPCPHILLALDVCYGGAFSQTKTFMPWDNLTQPDFLRLASDDDTDSPTYAPVATPELLARLMSDRTRLFLSSTGDTPAPDGDPGKHSPFARQLIDCLHDGERKPVVTAHDLYQSAANLQTAPTLTVFDHSNPTGDFVFVPTPAMEAH